MKAEKRIINRININRAAIAELNGEEHTPISIKEYQAEVVASRGKECWERMVLREREQMLTEKWAKEYKDKFQ